MARKVRIALTLDLDNPIHEKAYYLLSKLNRIHSEFIANITYNFLTQNYNGDIAKISKADAKMLALCAKYCCTGESYDFTSDPRVLGQLVMLLNQNFIINGSDVDNVIHKALANMNIYTGQAGTSSIGSSNNISQPVTSCNNSSDIEAKDDSMSEQNIIQQHSSSFVPDNTLTKDDEYEIDDEDKIDDMDSDEEQIEVNEAALRAFNSMFPNT